MASSRALLTTILAATALAGCGDEEERRLTDTQLMVQTTQELTAEASVLEREIAASADELAAAGADEREELAEPVADQRERAEEVAARAAGELPPELPVRDELVRAGERLAAAAEALEDYAESGDGADLAAARASLGEATRLRASASDQLADRPPAGLRELLDRLRELLPEAPPL